MSYSLSFTNESAHMPASNRLVMTLTFKQFFSAVLLGIFPIQNLEPSAVLSLCDVTAKFVPSKSSSQIRSNIYMLRISQWKRGRSLCQQPPKLLFAIQQSLGSQILPVAQQIECEKARRVPTVKHQIFELRSATSIQGTNFAVDDRSRVRQCSRDLLSKFREGSERVPIA